MSEAAELLPCPFCGGKGCHDVDGGYYLARCDNCHAEIHRETRKKVTAAWNTRAPLTQKPPE